MLAQKLSVPLPLNPYINPYDIIDEECVKDTWRNSAPIIINNVAGVVEKFYSDYLTPKNVSVTPTSSTSVKIDWEGQTGNYIVKMVSPANNEKTTTDSNYEQNGLQSSTNYCFKVVSTDNEGNRLAESETACGYTDWSPLLSYSLKPPTPIYSTLISPNKIGIGWENTGTNQSVAGYKIYKNGVYLTSTIGNSFFDNDIHPSLNSCYSVSAYNTLNLESKSSCKLCLLAPDLSLTSTGWEKTYSSDTDLPVSGPIQTRDGGYILLVPPNIIKLAGNGDKLWEKPYSTTSSLKALAAIQTIDDGYVLLAPPYLIKFSNNGDKLWEKTLENLKGQFIQAASDNGFIVGGANSSKPTTPRVEKYDINANLMWAKEFNDGFYIKLIDKIIDNGFILSDSVNIIKITVNGDTAWERIIGNETSPKFIDSIKQAYDGGYLALGTSYFDSGYPDGRFYANFTLKTDENGNIINNKSYNYFYNYNHLINFSRNFIQDTSDGGYLITGTEDRFIDATTVNQIIKIGKNGNVDWKIVNPFSPRRVIKYTTSDLGYFTIGMSTVNGDVNTVQKHDSTGTVIWEKDIFANINSVQDTSDGGYLMTGSVITANGKMGVYILKLDASRKLKSSDVSSSCTEPVFIGEDVIGAM